MRLSSKLLGILVVVISCSLSAVADTAGPFTFNFSGLTPGAGSLQPSYTSFTFPKFNASLGSLQGVDLAFSFSGTVIGNATGVNQSSSIFSTINHSVVFDFVDLSHNVGIGSPDLRLTQSIPLGMQQGTISFGPQFLSLSVPFTVGAGDPRFEAWKDGPGNVSALLGVSFSNWTIGHNGNGINFLGSDTGVYGGSFSVAYSYVPVPEPSSLAILAAASVLFVSTRRRRRDVS